MAKSHQTRLKTKSDLMNDTLKNDQKMYKRTENKILTTEIEMLKEEARYISLTGKVIDNCEKIYNKNYYDPIRKRGRPKGSKKIEKRKTLNDLRLVVNRAKLSKVIDIFQWLGKKPYEFIQSQAIDVRTMNLTPEEFAIRHYENMQKPRGIMDTFVNFLEDNKLILPNKQIKLMFLRKCKNLEEAEDINKNFKTIFKRLKRIRDKIKEEQIKDIKKSYVKHKCVFKLKKNIQKVRAYIEVLFDKLLLRYCDEDMMIYKNPLFDLKEGDIVCVYVDGKHSKCPSGWQQSFDFIFEQQYDGKRRAITFATALLKNTKQSTYARLFEFIRNCKCPRIPIIISDFEIAIFNSVRIIWPKSVQRGCYFHYIHNLLKRKTKINKYSDFKITLGALNLSFILPFVKYPSFYIHEFLLQYNLVDNGIYKNRDFKYLIYIFLTYVKKLRKIFLQNLSLSLIRTNNVAEGKNSSMSACFNKQPSLEEYINQLRYRYLNEKIQSWKIIDEDKPFDKLLLKIQKRANINYKHIIKFCNSIKKNICIEHSREILEYFKVNKKPEPLIITDEMDMEAEILLNRLSKRYSKYRTVQKKNFELINKLYKNKNAWKQLIKSAKIIALNENININDFEDNLEMSCSDNKNVENKNNINTGINIKSKNNSLIVFKKLKQNKSSKVDFNDNCSFLTFDSI